MVLAQCFFRHRKDFVRADCSCNQRREQDRRWLLDAQCEKSVALTLNPMRAMMSCTECRTASEAGKESRQSCTQSNYKTILPAPAHPEPNLQERFQPNDTVPRQILYPVVSIISVGLMYVLVSRSSAHRFLLIYVLYFCAMLLKGHTVLTAVCLIGTREYSAFEHEVLGEVSVGETGVALTEGAEASASEYFQSPTSCNRAASSTTSKASPCISTRNGLCDTGLMFQVIFTPFNGERHPV